MPRSLFGTDGIRGVAGSYPLDPPTVQAVGSALGRWAAAQTSQAEVVIGMDTRESSRWIAALLAGGLEHVGVRNRFAGLITTPGIAYVTRTGPFVAGVMISASHNPYQDNGIKIFDHSGYKLPDEREHDLEQDIFSLLSSGTDPAPAELVADDSLDRAYVDYLASTFPGTLRGKTIVVDCANGAASHLAPELFERLGASVCPVACEPDGRNINAGCGALHVDSLRRHVLSFQADAGVAFDGDADRAMFVSRGGRVLNGDHVLLLAARGMHAAGRLRGSGRPVVVATVMSNLGLERALSDLGISMARTAVGDKYVLEEMRRRGANLGGEQSGHVIFHEYSTTGDGLLTALRVFEIGLAPGEDLDALTAGLRDFPQLLVNIPVKTKRPLSELPAVAGEIRAAEAAFGDSGRILVRFSGTEPLARVMVEGPDDNGVRTWAHRIAEAIRGELG